MSKETKPSKVRKHIQKLPLEELPNVGSHIFRELDNRLTFTYLERDALPADLVILEKGDAERTVVFEGQHHDINISLFKRHSDPSLEIDHRGVFVISNGAGVATNTVDQLAASVQVVGMVDLKRDFTESKIYRTLRLVQSVGRREDVLVINIISGAALASDLVKALEKLHKETVIIIPIFLRFNGPNMDENQSRLKNLTEKYSNIRLSTSTADLVHQTTQFFHAERRYVLMQPEIARSVDKAIQIRADLGVTVDPKFWLTQERTIDYIFGSKKETRIGVLGFGRVARFQIQSMLAEGVNIAWAVTPTARKYRKNRIPNISVFPTVVEAVKAYGDVDIVLNYAPAAQVVDATRECIKGSPQMSLMLIVAEDTPYDNAIKMMNMLDAGERGYIGPNSPGIMIVMLRDGKCDCFKLGNMPAHLFSLYGGMSVVGRSGTVIFDIVDKATSIGVGTRLAWAIGGDKYTGLGMLDALIALEQDSQTETIVLNGEAGGIQEQLVASLVATGIISKPVVAMVTGKTLPAGIWYGHLGARKFNEADDPQVKEKHLQQAGVIVVNNPSEVAAVVRYIQETEWPLRERRMQALWEYFVEMSRKTGLRWKKGFYPTYQLIYNLFGHYALYRTHKEATQHLYVLIQNLAILGLDNFTRLLDSEIKRDSFMIGFLKSCEYIAEMIRGINEIGIDNFCRLVSEVLSKKAFNAALQTTPWAAADLINEAHEVGISEIKNVIDKTIGMEQFRKSLSEKPWNTAHSFRSINNMRWWRYIRAYDRYCLYLTGDNQVLKASWMNNPWVTVKLVRGYDRITESGLEQALEDLNTKKVFFEKSKTDPQGLLELGKRAFQESRQTGKLFSEGYVRLVNKGISERPTIEGEMARMSEDDINLLVNIVFTPSAFSRSIEDHRHSTAQALRIINQEGNSNLSGAQRIVCVYIDNINLLDTPAFHLAVSRNLWMAVDLLRALSRLQPIDVQRIADYVLSPPVFNYAVAEHQWGTSQAFHKIADMGASKFLDTHRIIEDVTHDKESFRIGFDKNPRDLVEIVQVVDRLTKKVFAELMDNAETREAFLNRMRVSPRNAAHFLQEVTLMGGKRFNQFIDNDLGRGNLNELLRCRGCDLVHIMRRINIVGVDNFCDELRIWKSEDSSNTFRPEKGLDISGILKERILDKKFSDPLRTIDITLNGQPSLKVSEGEIFGLYRSYPEWGDVLFKLQAGEQLTSAEQVDVYLLVSGRKRFQKHMVPVLSNFIPQKEIRKRIKSGQPLIKEIALFRRVPQGPGHRFDLYFHTLASMDQLVNRVFPLDFVSNRIQRLVSGELNIEIDRVKRHWLLILATALHDFGKVANDGRDHVKIGIEMIQPILDRLGLTGEQKLCVNTIIKYHRPKRIRRPGEAWNDFAKRGGLDLLFEQMVDDGRNIYLVETILNYHADILGRLGEETPDWQVMRRQEVTRYLLERHFFSNMT